MRNILRGKAGSDTLQGGACSDHLHGDDGDDILRGGAGDDVLRGGLGNDLLLGEEGDDLLRHSAGHNLLIGGRGDDVVTAFTGRDVIAFNRGDGRDTVRLMKGEDKTLSLGGEIRYEDLAFEKSGLDLLLHTASEGPAEQIRFANWYDDWYADTPSRALSTLQVIMTPSTGYDPAAIDPLRKYQVQRFDFAHLARQFDQTRDGYPPSTQWKLADSLAGAYIDGSDSMAIGGALAFTYGTQGSLAGISDPATRNLLAAPVFGSLQPLMC